VITEIYRRFLTFHLAGGSTLPPSVLFKGGVEKRPTRVDQRFELA